jgi:hypothetical protein
LSGFNNLQAADVTEFAGVKCGYGPMALQGSRGDDQIVGADHLTAAGSGGLA